jgi:hypothetical protein
MYRIKSAGITLLVAFTFALAFGFAMDGHRVRAAEASTAATGDALLNVAHFAPFAADAAGTAVTVTVNGSAAITNFVFPDVVKGVALPPGVYTVGVQLPDGTPIITVTTELMTDTEYFVAAIGGVNGYMPTLYPLVVDRTPPTDTAKVRITHLAPFTSSVAATAVDICNDDTATPIISGLQFLSTTGYLNLPPAVYDLSVAVAGTACAGTAIDLPPVRLRTGQTIEVIARGLLPGSADASLDLGLYTEGITAAGDATVNVAHFAPFAANAAGTAVTVTVNGNPAITNLVFPDVVKNIVLPVGTYELGVQLPDGTPIITATTELMTDTEYFVAAIGGVNGYTPTLYPLIVDRTPPTDTAKVRITHLAPFTSSVAATAVDICNDATDTPIISGLQFLSTTGYLNLPPAAYDLSVAVAGTDCATTALDLPAFRLRTGQTAEVIARGLLPSTALATADASLDLGVYIDAQAGVAVAHFAPFASTITNTAVTVRVDGSDVLTGVVFPNITGYLNLAPGEHLIQILPSGSSTPVISETVTVDPLAEYTVAAVGIITDNTDLGLRLQVFTDDNATQPVSGTTRLRVAHLAPFAPTLTGTEVDLCTSSGAAPVLNNVPFGASAVIGPAAGLLSTFIALPTPDCGTSALNLPVLALDNGQIVYIYALGGANGLPLQIAATSPTTVNVAVPLYQPILADNVTLP